jgi:hypothetical protein
MTPLKKKSVIGLIVVILSVSIFGNFAYPQPARAGIIADIMFDFPGAMEYYLGELKDMLKAALLTAGIRAASYALRKVAYDSAVWIASGGKGQQPLAFNKGFGGYIKDVANEAGGAAVEELGKPYGLNLCKIPDIKVDLAMRIGLRTQFSAPAKPSCSFSDFTKNWSSGLSKYARNGSIINNFNVSLKADDSSDFGIYTKATEQINTRVWSQQNAKTLDRQEGQGFKPVNTLIADSIVNPSQNVKKTAGGQTPDEVMRSNEAQLNAALAGDNTKVFPAVLSIFLSTLSGTIINNFQTKGILPFGLGCLHGSGPNCTSGSGTGTSADAILSYEGEGMTSLGRAAMRSFFSYMTAVQIKETDKYDLLTQLNSCPESPGAYNCRAGDDLVNAANQFMTIRDAIDKKVLDGGRKLLPPTQKYLAQCNDINNAYQSVYCLNNVRVLRQVRILPLGFEIAVQNANPDEPPTLDRVVKEFEDSNSPYYRLVDPNWVIKAPLAKCNALVSSANLMGSDVPNRLQDCVDLQTCVSYGSNGSCNDFAYCTREKNTWKFAADSCDQQYATCKTYERNDGSNSSYLERTLDKLYCNKGNVGCTGYSLAKDSTGTWQTPSFTATQTSNNGIYFNANVASGCSEDSVGCTAFNISDSIDGPLYLKKAPDYLGCYDTNRTTALIDWPQTASDLARISNSPECDNYSKACIPDEASCNWYSPLTGGGVNVPGRFIPAVVTNNYVTWNDQCDAKCVGYNTYKEMPSNYSNGQDLAYIIPSSGRVCSAAQEGCASFTNLSTTTAGIESVEYYSYLRPCMTVQEATGTVKTFITYEGSKEGGFQLKTYRLVFTNDPQNSPAAGGPKYFYKDLTELSQMNAECTETRYKAGSASLDCRQFNDEGGRTYYRLLSKTIPVTESCTPYRLNNPEFYIDSSAATPAACANQSGYWDNTGRCNMCVQNGVYKSGACIYEGLPSGVDNNAGISQVCSAEIESCRAYKGNAGNNIQTVLSDTFESASSTVGWTAGVSWAPVSTHVGEHSLEYDPAGTFSKTIQLEPGKSYDLTFWAYAGSGGTLDVSLDSAGTPVTSTSFGLVSVSSIWKQYHLGPFEFKGNTTTALLSFRHDRAGAVFIDNLRLVKVADYIYLVKNSLSVDPVCDSHPEDNLPGEALGCEAYQDPQDRVFYLTNFSYLCREDAIGCTALFDTQNTSASESAQVFNVFFSGSPGQTISHFGQSCMVDGGKLGCYVNVTGYTPAQIRSVVPDALTTSSVYIAADTPSSSPIYLVASKGATCPSSDLGCTYAGKRVQTATGTYYATTTIKNDPGTYNDTLCESEAEGCGSFSNGSSVQYFKDPEADGTLNCVYKTDVPYTQGAATSRITGWFWKDPAGTCANNHSRICTTQNANQDCGIGIQCQNQPCYLTSGSYDVLSYGVPGYSEMVGECPSDQNTCTQFVDHSDVSNGPGGFSYYIKNDDKVTEGECSGGVSQKAGCALFDQVDNPTKMWNTTSSYALSVAVDNRIVVPTTTSNNDSNIIIKVIQDRECGEWLECGSSYSAFDEVSGKYRNICNRIQRCNPQDGCGALGNNVTSTLTQAIYVNRDVSWSGMDYDGFSLFGYYPIEQITQMNFNTSTSNPEWRLVRKVPCGNNCAVNMMNAYSCGDTTQTTLYPGGRYVDGVNCGTSVQPGVCINFTCVQMPNGTVASDMMASAPRQLCRAYPEETSPFPNTTKISKSSSYKAANMCDDQDPTGCECDYRKVTYGGSGAQGLGDTITRYWKYNELGSIDKNTLVADRNLYGICFGGVSSTAPTVKMDGKECSYDRDCGDGGACEIYKGTRQFLGWRGFCLESDTNRTINADPSQSPCFTWFPVESLEGTADVYNQHGEAGLDWHPASTGQYYCLRASGSTSTDVYFLELSPDGLYAQGNNWGSYAWSNGGQASQILPDLGYGTPWWSWWREKHSKRNYNHYFTYFGRAHVDLIGDNAGKAGIPAANEASVTTQAGLTNDHKKLVGVNTGGGSIAGKSYTWNNLRYYNGTLVSPNPCFFGMCALGFRNDRYANGGAMNTYDGFFNIAGYEKAKKHDDTIFPVNKAINRLDIDRIEVRPVNASRDIAPSYDTVFYLFPNETASIQSRYAFTDSLGPTGKALVGYYQGDQNQLILFLANNGGQVGDQGQLSFPSGHSFDHGNLFTTGGMTNNNIWGSSPNLCATDLPGGSFGWLQVQNRWHALKFNFSNSGELVSFDTAYCGNSGGEGGGNILSPWVEYRISIVYKKWCSNIVDGRINLSDNSLKRTIAWTDRLFNLTESYTVPQLGYTYNTTNPSFGSLDGYSNIGAQAVVARTVPNEWGGLDPQLCTGPRNCYLDPSISLVSANGYDGREYSPADRLLSVAQGADLLGTLYANAKGYVFGSTVSGYVETSNFNNNTLTGDPVTSGIVPKPPEVHPLGNCISDPAHNNSIYCEELPQKGFSVNFQSATGTVKDVVAGASQGGLEANRFTVNFFMFADPNQMPLRQVIVDWGDNNATPVKGYFRNQRGVTSTDPIRVQCVSQLAATDYGHVVDMTCDNTYFTAANTFGCSSCMPKTCQSATDTNCFAPAGSPFCPSALQSSGCCIFIPRVQVKDNWGWCNGSCSHTIGTQTVNGCYDYNNSSGQTSDECVNLPQNRNAWTYLGGSQTNPGRIILKPSTLQGACNVAPILSPNGASCARNAECASGTCGADGFCKGGPGAVCVTDNGCSSGSCAFSGFCGNPVASGEQCNSNADCITGACAGGTCKSTNGTACSSDAACASGACIANTCGAPRSSGGACDSNADCVENNCTGGICKTLEGQACTADSSCMSGACISSRCSSPGGLSAACDSNPDCLSNSCSAGRCLASYGATCTTDAQCANGGCGPQSTTDPALVCVGQRTGGNTCNSNPDCTSNSCSGGVCLGALYETCSGDAGCASGTSCVNSQCVAPVINGLYCDSSPDCSNGSCNTTEPVPPNPPSSTYQMCIGANGTPCANDLGCANGSCYGGICGPVLANGSTACDSDLDCVGGICNYQTTATSTVMCLATPKANGGACNSNADCTSGACIGNICADKRNIGAACDTNLDPYLAENDGDCLSNSCFNGRCINPGGVGAACDTDPDCQSPQYPDPGAVTSGCGPSSPSDSTMVCKAP